MSLDPPSDLIKKSKITFRKDAKISSSYNKQQTLNIPNIQTSLSALEKTSSSSLSDGESISCKNCNYKLLRGSHSLICIYCGQCQADHLRPESIEFKSTVGYRWLLRSLELNDSERIDTFFEENRRNKGGTPAEEGIPLAELFDVQITWPDEHIKPESGCLNKTLDRCNSLSFDKIGWENFATSSQRDGGSDVSEEQSVGSKNDPNDAFRDDETFSLFQNDSPHETDAISRASSEHDSDVQYVSSRTKDEDSKATVSRNSSSGDDEELHTGDSNAYIDVRGDSSPGHNVVNQFIESRIQTDDSKATVSRDSSVGDNVEIDVGDLKIQNEDSDASCDFGGDSLSGNRTGTQVVKSRRTRKQVDVSKTVLNRKSSSGDDSEIPSVSFRTRNEDSDISPVLRGDSSPGHDTDIQIDKSGRQKHDSKTDLNQESLSEYNEVQSPNFFTRIGESKTANVSSDLRDDSSSGSDTETRSVGNGKPNDHSNTTAAILPLLKKDSSSEDEAKVKSLNVMTHSEDSKSTAAIISDLRIDSSSEDEAKIKSRNVTTQNEDSKPDSRRDSSSEDEAKLKSLDVTTDNDSKSTASIIPNLRSDSSSEDETKVKSLNVTTDNENSISTAAIFPDPQRDSSSEDEDKVKSLNVTAHDEDSKSTALIFPDSRRDSSSDDEAKVKSLDVTTHNVDYKSTASIIPDLRNDSSSEDEAKIKSLNVTTHNEDSKSTASILPDSHRNSSSEDEATIHSVNVMTRNNDSKSTAAIFPNLRRDSSSEDETEVKSVNVMTHNEDSKIPGLFPDSRGGSSSGSDAENHSLNARKEKEDSSSGDESKHHPVNVMPHNKDSETPAAFSNSRGDSSSESDAEIQSLNSRKQNKESITTTAISSDLRQDSPSGDEDSIQSLNSVTRNKDSKSTDRSSDFRGDSSSDDDTMLQPISSSTQIKESKTNAAVSSDLKRDSSSGDDAGIRSVSWTHSVDSESSGIMRGDSSVGDDAEILHTTSQADLRGDLRRESFSGDDGKIQFVNTETQNDESETNTAPSDLRDDSPSWRGEETNMNSRKSNESSKPDLSRDSSSGDDMEIRFANSIAHNVNSNSTSLSSDLRGDGSPRIDEEIRSAGYTTLNEASKATASVSSDIRGDSLSPDDKEIQYLNAKTNDEDSKTDVSRKSSFGDDTEIPGVNSVTRNVDSTSASVSSNLRGDSSPRLDEEIRYVDSTTQKKVSESTSGGDMETELVNISTQNDDTKDAAVSSDLRGDGSLRHNEQIQFVKSNTTDDVSLDLRREPLSGDDTEIQFVNIKTPNADSNTAVVSSGFSSDDSSRHDAGIEPTSSRTRNDDSEAVLSRVPSSKDDAEIQFPNFKSPNEDFEVGHSKPTSLSGSSSFRDDADIQPVKSGTKNEDSKTAPMSSHLSSEFSFADNTKVQSKFRMQNEDIQSQVVSSRLRSESPPGDDTETWPIKSSLQNEDFKSADSFEGSEVNLSDHRDPIPRYMEDMDNESLSNNLDPVQDDDSIKDNPTHKD